MCGSGVPFGQLSAAFAGPTFFRGNLRIASAAQLNDTFLELPGWTKGFALVNGFNLGRHMTHTTHTHAHAHTHRTHTRVVMCVF